MLLYIDWVDGLISEGRISWTLSLKRVESCFHRDYPVFRPKYSRTRQFLYVLVETNTTPFMDILISPQNTAGLQAELGACPGSGRRVILSCRKFPGQFIGPLGGSYAIPGVFCLSCTER